MSFLPAFSHSVQDTPFTSVSLILAKLNDAMSAHACMDHLLLAGSVSPFLPLWMAEERECLQEAFKFELQCCQVCT